MKSTMTETCGAVLRSRRNCSSDGAERTDDGRAFHARAAVTGKARSPSVVRRVMDGQTDSNAYTAIRTVRIRDLPCWSCEHAMQCDAWKYILSTAWSDKRADETRQQPTQQARNLEHSPPWTSTPPELIPKKRFYERSAVHVWMPPSKCIELLSLAQQGVAQ